MCADYIVGEIMSVSADADEITIRLDLGEGVFECDQDTPVANISLKGCPNTAEALANVEGHALDYAALTFRTEGEDTVVEVGDYEFGEIWARIVFGKCEITKEKYSYDELADKLARMRAITNQQLSQSSNEARRYAGMLHRLRNELWKEADRFERKATFFANTAPGERYETGVRCYQKALNMLDYIEKNGPD